MKNPFIINFFWLSTVAAICSATLLAECRCCYPYNETLRDIIIGILSSAILLLLAELILFIRDNSKFSFLADKYKRIDIYQINEDKKRWTTGETIKIKGGKDEIKEGEERSIDGVKYGFKNGILTIGEKKYEYKNDSCYHRLSFYDDLIDNKKIELEYLFNGKYSGTVEYDEGATKISITLDNTNEMQGKGTYQYTERINNKLPDLGTYEIQVDELNKSQIYVYYKNTIPSGLAEGYEIWKKIKTA